MPTYEVELSDGRKFHVDADSQPSEEDVLSHLGGEAGPFVNKETATSEQFAPAPEPFSVKNFITGGDNGPSVKGALENTARSLHNMRQGVKSAVLSPLQTLKAIDKISPESIGQGIADRVGQYVNDPAETIYNDPLAFGMDATMVGGAAKAGISGTLRAASSQPAKIALAGAKAGAANIPGVSNFVKSVYKGGAEEAARLAEMKRGRLSMVKAPPINPRATAGLPAQDVENALTRLRSPDPVKTAGMVKTPTGVAERNAVSPQQNIPGMTATLPDKWGASTIQESGSPLRADTKPAMTPPTPMSPAELIKGRILMQQGMSKAEAAAAIIKARNYAGRF